ncbi:OstA family protein [Thermodesulfobium narugense DSM 14796]|uniref:OstA family protein n=1 Tax=Thermodesulfobium narugense DSM 14796 TaxID=747365 RepID=M1E9J7_9BACT|nr:OstA family protein [Thermodesulfobium narugense]AEE15399.1 OstA family protein [Thermodesulfobium narugense DSM 14796]
MNFIRIFLVFFVTLFLLTGISFAETPNVKADQVYLDFGSGTWVAEGNVVITYKDYEFTGEKAEYYPNTSVLDLFNGKLSGKDVSFLAKKIILKKSDNKTNVDAFNVKDGVYKEYSFSCNELTLSDDIATLIGNASIGSSSSRMTGDKFSINLKTGKIEGTNVKSANVETSSKKDTNNSSETNTNTGQ